MPDLKEDKKELATNRLLEILRGDSEDESQEAPDGLLGLSEEEQIALSGETQPAEAEKDKLSGLKESLSLDSILDKIRSKVRNFINPRQGLIGIDIGTDSIKYVYFVEEKHETVLKDIGIRKVEEHYTGDPAKKVENIRKAINELIPKELKNTTLVSTTVFGQNVSIKKISLPKIPKKELRDAVVWNAKKDLPFSGNDATIDFKILGETQEKGVDKIEVLAAIVEQKLIDDQVKLFESIGVEPAKILAIPLSIYYNFLLFSDNPDEASGVVIDIGAKVTNIIFIHEGNLQFAREISTGGDDITNAMVGTITGTEGSVKIDKEEAERLKFIHGIPSDDMLLTTDHGITLNQIASLMRPAIERLTVQIQRSFDYYRTKFPYDEPEKIYLSGGTALLKNIDTFLADGLNKSVEILNPFNKIKIEPGLEEEKNVSDVAPSLSVAVGTAFSDKKGINLLPRELKDKLLFAVQKRILTVAAAVVLFIISTMSFFAFTEYNSVNGELEQARIDKQPSDTNQNIFTVLNNQRTRIIDKQRADESDYQKFAGTTQIKDYLYLLSMYTPRIISLEEVSIDLTERNTFSLFGRIFTDLSFAEIELSDFFIKLKNTGMFSRISGYETDPAALEIDMALVMENSKWFQINWGLAPSVNYE